MRKSILLILPFLAEVAFAGAYMSPVPLAKQTTVSGLLEISEVEYEGEGGGELEVERKVLGAEFLANFSPSVWAGGYFGYVFNAETDGNYEGNGFHLGGTVLGEIHQSGKTAFFGYGVFEYMNEDLKHENIDIELENTYTGLKGGVAFRYTASKKLRPYAAVEFYLLNDGELKPDGGQKSEYERDQALAIRLGMQFTSGNSLFVRPELVLMGETTFVIAAGTTM